MLSPMSHQRRAKPALRIASVVEVRVEEDEGGVGGDMFEVGGGADAARACAWVERGGEGGVAGGNVSSEGHHFKG